MENILETLGTRAGEPKEERVDTQGEMPENPNIESKNNVEEEEVVSDEERERRRIANLQAVVAAKRPQVQKDDAVRLLRDDYLSQVIQSIEAQVSYSDDETENEGEEKNKNSLSDNKKSSKILSRMPLFHQRNELYLGYMEFNEEEIATLGRAIFENPLIASTVNHINFAGNQLTPERFTLFLHLVIAPLMFYSGALAVANKVDLTNCIGGSDETFSSASQQENKLRTSQQPKSSGFFDHEAIDTDDIRANIGKLIGEIAHGVAFAKKLVTDNNDNTEDNSSYANPAVLRNASSGYGRHFGITGIECDNNGASTDGWKAFVAMLTADEDFILGEGESVRKQHLGAGGKGGKDEAYYTLTGAYSRLTFDLLDNKDNNSGNNELTAEEEILSFMSYHHATTFSHIDIAENYIHDVGARYAAVLLEACPNLKIASFITNQLSSRAAKDVAAIFEARFDAIADTFPTETASCSKERLLALKEVESIITLTAARTEGEGHEEDKSRDAALASSVASVIRSIAASSRLVDSPYHHKTKEALGFAAHLFPPYSVTPKQYLAYPYCVAPSLTEFGYPFCIQQLYLDYNSFGDAGARTVLTAIGNKCPSLTKLGLSDNRLGDDGGVAVAELIISNPRSRVQHLNLSVNCISNAGGIAIAKALSCAYVIANNDISNSDSPSYTLYFKKGVRFDRPPAHVYDPDSDLYIDELAGIDEDSSNIEICGIPVTIIPEEVDGEDGLGEGEAYSAKLSFTNDSVTLTQQQVDLLLVASAEEGKKLTINTRLYHLDLANQTKFLTAEGRSAIAALAFSYKYDMNLDITALDVSNAEMRQLARSLHLGANAVISHDKYYRSRRSNSNINDSRAGDNTEKETFSSCVSTYWQYTCGLINAEWYNNPSIFPATERLMGEALEEAIDKCQVREAFVEEHLKSTNSALNLLRKAAMKKAKKCKMAAPKIAAAAATSAEKESRRVANGGVPPLALVGAAVAVAAVAMFIARRVSKN